MEGRLDWRRRRRRRGGEMRHPLPRSLGHSQTSFTRPAAAQGAARQSVRGGKMRAARLGDGFCPSVRGRWPGWRQWRQWHWQRSANLELSVGDIH
ncbi:MAG: hypothetical protein J0L63_18465 [Anaerolineae bacterium]|nr:hypothetical protein [Anaerolineae bacterium]